MDNFAFGTQYIVEAYGADAEKLMSELHIKALLLELGQRLEPDGTTTLSMLQSEDDTGVSASLILAESHISIHTYVKEHQLVLKAFTRKGLELKQLKETLVSHFEVARVEVHSSSFGKNLPHDSKLLQTTLLGERQYNSARLQVS